MFVLVNLKAYPCDPVAVARAAHEVSMDSSAEIVVAPQAADIGRVADTGVTTFAQHVSPVSHGSYTGTTIAEATAENGATGTLLNHSEQRLKLADIDSSIGAANRTDFDTVVCANTPEQIAAVTALGPDAVAIEPPELIGTGTPVSQADPDIVTDAVAAAEVIDPTVDVYCGAGITTGDDLIAAQELGASGVLLASGVAKAEEPTDALRELVAPLE